MNALNRYMRDVESYPTLSADEQDLLAKRFSRDRDPRDAKCLVVANLRLVLTIARALGGAHCSDLPDLVQEGNAGLMIAVDRFDPARGPTLSAYAAIWIKAYVMRHIMENRHVVRMTTTREGRRQFFAHALPGDVHLDATVGDESQDGTRATRLDFLPSDERLRPDVTAETHEETRRLQAAIAHLEATLGARERAILDERLLSENPRPLRQVGTAMKVSGERVRQLEQRMVDRLRVMLLEPTPEDTRQAA